MASTLNSFRKWGRLPRVRVYAGWLHRFVRWLVWNQAHHLIIICETFVTMISGFPRYRVIFPDTATVLPPSCDPTLLATVPDPVIEQAFSCIPHHRIVSYNNEFTVKWRRGFGWKKRS